MKPQVLEILLESVRRFVQPNARYNRKVPAMLLEGASFPHLATVEGVTVAVISKEALCGDYYD